MKREIKFRAFQDNQMLVSPISSNYGLQRFFGMLYEDAPIMQFTGLKDKNGVEIYEGDLLAIGVSDFGMMHRNYEVIFEDGKYVLKRTDLPFNWGCISRLSEMNWECEIIANIYETKTT